MVTAEAVRARVPPRQSRTFNYLHTSAWHFTLTMCKYWIFHKAHLHCLGTKERMLGVLRVCWCVRSIILCLLFDLCRFRLCAAKRSFAPLNTDVKMSPLNEAGRVWSVIYLFGKLAHYQAAAHLHSPQLPDLLIQIFKNIFFLDSDKQYESSRTIMRKHMSHSQMFQKV